MQPTYLPWLGYYEMMAQSDVFVLFDDVQYVKKSWHQKNRIKSAAGELVLVVPVKTSGARFQKINEAFIDNAQDWKKKHLKSILLNYAKAPFFNQYKEDLRRIYTASYRKLIEVDVAIIDFLKTQLRINTPIVLSSTIAARDGRNEKIIDICRYVNADVLYDTKGAIDIINVQQLSDSGLKVMFQEYNHPEYSQQHGKFIPYLSVLDLLLNQGERSLEIILSGSKR